MKHTKAEREKIEKYDYMMPIIADADMGFGGLTTTVKLAKLFVESGVAMIHMDDLAIGLKKFTIGEGRTVVPTSEYVTRLTAVRMQFDIMG
jgi:isocitrate lyase